MGCAGNVPFNPGLNLFSCRFTQGKTLTFSEVYYIYANVEFYGIGCIRLCVVGTLRVMVNCPSTAIIYKYDIPGGCQHDCLPRVSIGNHTGMSYLFYYTEQSPAGKDTRTDPIQSAHHHVISYNAARLYGAQS